MNRLCEFFRQALFGTLMHTWDEAIFVARDTNLSKALILYIRGWAQMKKCSFLFGVYPAEVVLRHTGNQS